MIKTIKYRGSKFPYYLIEDANQLIYVVLPGLNGMEFNKTVGFFSNFPGVQTYQCLYGSGILLMQRNDELGEAKEFKMVTLSAAKSVAVPAGWAVCLVNSGSNFLVVLTNSVDKQYIDVKPIQAKHGLAYQVIDKRGEIVFESNPYYSVHPQISTE